MRDLTPDEQEAMEAVLGKRPVASDVRADYDRLAWAYSAGLARSSSPAPVSGESEDRK